MRDLVTLLVHLIATVAKLLLPGGGARSVVAESLLLKHQLLIHNRSRARAPNLRPIDRVIAGLCAGLMRPSRLQHSTIVLKPSTIMGFHRAWVKRKYRVLFSPQRRARPGPKRPAPELITAIVEMKHRNARFGCRRSLSSSPLFSVSRSTRMSCAGCSPSATGLSPALEVRRGSRFLGHPKDSRWSVDLLRCESLILRTHWVIVVMDQFTRRIIGFGVHAGVLDGPAICRMLSHAIAGH